MSCVSRRCYVVVVIAILVRLPIEIECFSKSTDATDLSNMKSKATQDVNKFSGSRSQHKEFEKSEYDRNERMESEPIQLESRRRKDDTIWGFPDWLVVSFIAFCILSCCRCLSKTKECTDYDYNEYGIQNVDENASEPPMLSRDSPLRHLPIWNTNTNDNGDISNGMPLYVRIPNTVSTASPQADAALTVVSNNPLRHQRSLNTNDNVGNLTGLPSYATLPRMKRQNSLPSYEDALKML